MGDPDPPGLPGPRRPRGVDRRYWAVRAQLSSRQTCFEHRRALAQYLPFDAWEDLFDFIIDIQVPAMNAAMLVFMAGATINTRRFDNK